MSELEKLQETCEKGITITVNSSSAKWVAKDGSKTLWKLDTTPPRADGRERLTMSEKIKEGGEFTVDEDARQKNEQFPPQIYLTQTQTEGGFRGGGGRTWPTGGGAGGGKSWTPSDRDVYYCSVSCLLAASDVVAKLVDQGQLKTSKDVMATTTMLAHHNRSLLESLKEHQSESS